MFIFNCLNYELNILKNEGFKWCIKIINKINDLKNNNMIYYVFWDFLVWWYSS